MSNTIFKKMKDFQEKHYLSIELTVLFCCITIYFLAFKFMDNDGWFILNNGRYILKHGIPYKNPFTFLPDLDIVIQQWLWSVITYKIYDISGFFGIYILCILTWIIALILLMKIGKLFQCPTENLMALSTGGLMLMSLFLNIRPTFITIILLLFQVYVLEQYRLKNNWKYLLWLPIISFLEINLHAAIWIFHFVFLLPYIVPPIKNPLVDFVPVKCKVKNIVFMIPFMFLAGFLNPYGTKGMLYLCYSYGDQLKNAKIKELMAPATDNIGISVLVIGMLVLIWIVTHRHKQIDSSLFYILCGTSILSLSHMRNIVYFFLGVTLFSILIAKDFHINSERFHKHSKTVCYISTFLLFAATMYSVYDHSEIIKNQEENDGTMTPYKAVKYFEEQNVGKEAKIYTEFNSGAYVEWNGYKGYMDPRPELYFKKLNNQFEYFKEYNDLLTVTDPKQFKAFVEKYQFDYMVVGKTERMNLYLDMNGYEKVVDGNGYYCYKTKD